MKLVTLLSALLAATAGAQERPHIVLVMADDQGWGDMAYTGHPALKTPNFDAAAAAGLRFDRFYAAAPVCSPTRASVMTGRHPGRMGVFKWGYSIRPQEKTIAEALAGAGYVTGHFGKWHLGSVRRGAPDSPGAAGFQEWLSAPNFYDNDAVMSHKGRAVPKRGESSFIAVDAALDWIATKAKEDAPIFAVVWFGSPHSPHRAAERDRALYAKHGDKLQNFYGEITGMDRAFGKLRRSLRELGIHENTLLWYCSDNGALRRVGRTGGHRGHKGKVYEGGLLVPAFLEWPKRVKSPRTTEVRCNTSDIYPTLVEIAGCKVEQQPRLDGVSLASLIADAAERPAPRGMGFWDRQAKGIPARSTKLMAELLAAQGEGRDLPPSKRSKNAARLPHPPHSLTSFPGHAAWIEEEWKLHRIERRDGDVRWELYHLATDPGEKSDVRHREADRVDQMRKRLLAWLESVARSYNGEDY